MGRLIEIVVGEFPAAAAAVALLPPIDAYYSSSSSTLSAFPIECQIFWLVHCCTSLSIGHYACHPAAYLINPQIMTVQLPLRIMCQFLCISRSTSGSSYSHDELATVAQVPGVEHVTQELGVFTLEIFTRKKAFGSALYMPQRST